MHIQNDIVVDCQPKEEADQAKLLLSLEGGGVEPVQPGVLVVHEQTWERRGREEEKREGGEWRGRERRERERREEEKREGGREEG